ncbi:glycine receptor subunit alpha-2 isoform X1 [Apis mellifera]|uniref:Glycine receptor subunit alpha-2 isoform X1 n=2 Tax=Apis mellifera TaxID=7460 RepID=A0A7M7RAB6_APIME|nr:glycine receptor subunit alpha-2 isoform X1 [Apis mellifera]|eukprot:XP_623445.3 glycine receptor subunit alpha-2 isoform X1 [Apis mellifera]
MMKNTILTVLFYSCLKLFVCSSVSLLTDDAKNSTLKSRIVLPEHYVKEIRPPSKQGLPVLVDFNIFVADINSINVEDMDFRVDMFVRQSWIESRLDMPDYIFEEGDDYVTLPPEFFDSLWQPDPYFLNAKVSEIAALNHKFSSVTLYRNKTVKYSARMHAIIACQMEFQLYPMDIQICPIYIESFSYHKQKLRLRWGTGAVTVNPELKLLQYDIGKPVVAEETVDYMLEKSGNFSRLVVFFRFERQIGHHLIQTFAPSTLVVMLSWFSFWLGLDAIPGRVALLVTSMLTLVTMFTGLKSDIPPVAYVKALDVWMAGCMMFVFAALGEFVVVKVLDLRSQLEYDLQTSIMSRHYSTRAIVIEKGQSIWDYDSTYIPKVKNKKAGSKHLLQNTWLDPEYPMIRVHKTQSQTIDIYSRIGFPILFMLFIILYWPILLFKKAM